MQPAANRVANRAARQDIKIVVARLAAFVCLALLLVVSILKVDTSSSEQYEAYMQTYGKRYEENEKQYRQYLKIKKEMSNHKHNEDPESDYFVTLNEFSDLSEEEFERLYLSLNDIRLAKQIPIDHLEHDIDSKFNINWTAYLPPVKDRGLCRADYAFAAVGSVEALVNMKNNATSNRIVFSEQQIIDCCERCSGCEGSTDYTGNTTEDIGAALEYIQQHGLERQVAYPYQNKKQDCKSTLSADKQKIKESHVSTTFKGLTKALKLGPVIVTVDARNWRDYGGGVFTNCGRRKTHLALLVGRTSQYFIVRNSWGRRWGERGYIRLGMGFTCGITSEAYFPTL